MYFARISRKALHGPGREEFQGFEERTERCAYPLIWLQCKLLGWFEFERFQLLYFTSENLFCGNSRVYTVRLDGNHSITPIFKEVVRVQRDDACLIRLCDVREDDINL